MKAEGSSRWVITVDGQAVVSHPRTTAYGTQNWFGSFWVVQLCYADHFRNTLVFTEEVLLK
jgi:hypothetical protein